MLKPITVTVGLCVKNSGLIIKKAIESLCNQSFPAPNIQLIVVDGNSRDNTIRVIKENLTSSFHDVRILKENSGLGIARQIVVQLADGKYIVWLDADMTLSQNYLQNQVAFMENHPEVAIAGGKYNLDIGHGLAADLENIVYVVDSVYSRRGRASKFGYLPGAEGAIYRVKAVRQVGGFDIRIDGAAEDTEMAYRVRDNGWKLAVTEEKFTESTRTSWYSLWKQYLWYGRGGHFVFHKNPGSLNLIQMSPMAGFFAGVLRSPGAYLLTHRTSSFLLPLHYTYKRIAWLFGFLNAHIEGYGHGLN